MKQELIKKLMPVVEEFVDDVLKSFDDIEKIRASITQKELLYQDLIQQKEKELSDIRIRKASDKKYLDEKITALEDSKNKHADKERLYESLNAEVERKRKDIDNDLDNARLELIRAKDIRMQAEKVKADSEKSRNDYNLKLNSLKQDDEKIKKEKEEQGQRNKSLNVRDKDICEKETRNENRTLELNDLDLKIKVDRKEIDRLIKRYKLEQSLKEA